MYVFKFLAGRLGRRQTTTLPSKCYNACNNAQTEAQSVGKTPALCEAGGYFQVQLQACTSCLASSTTNASDYISSGFGQYIDYCGSGDSTSPTQSNQVIVQLITATADLTVRGGLTHVTLTTSLTISLNASSINFSSVATAGSTTVISLSTTPPLTSVNSTGSASPTATNTNLISSATSTPSPTPSPESKAWIAGPIVGSVAGVAILALMAFFLYRRRRISKRKGLSNEYMDKPQLHSDCVPRAPPEELDAGMRHELPGDEPRDENAMVTELPGKDSPKILDKTHGRSELPSYEPGQLPS